MNIKTYIDILVVTLNYIWKLINLPIKNKINLSFDHRIETGQTFIKHICFSFLLKSAVIFINFYEIYIYIYIGISWVCCGFQWISWHQRLPYQLSCVCNHSYRVMRVHYYLCLQLLSNLALSSSTVSLTIDLWRKISTWLSSPSRLSLVYLNPVGRALF